MNNQTQLTFHTNYTLHGKPGTISTLTILHADTVVGHIVQARGQWIYWSEGVIQLTETMLKQIEARLHCMNKKHKTAPPTGFLKCIACGVLVAIEDNLHYNEQCTCPNHHCDGQMMCNEFKGWS